MKPSPEGSATLQARLEHLVDEMLQKGIRLEEAAREFERSYISKALSRCDGCKTDAARLLGLHRNTLASRMNNHDAAARKKRVPARRRPRR